MFHTGNTGNIGLVSVQPYFIIEASHYRRMEHGGNRFLTRTIHFTLSRDCSIPLVPDCFSTLLLPAFDEPSVLITPVTLPGQNIRLRSGTYYAAMFTPLASYSLYQLFSSTPVFTDQVLPAETVFPSISELERQIAQAAQFHHVSEVICCHFARLFQFAPITPHLEDLIMQILISNCSATDADLSAACGLSTRYIYKLFKTSVGCSPKTFSRILRFHNVLSKLLTPQHYGPDHAPYILYYYDQSHFLREFRKFSGISPAQMQKLLSDRKTW